MAGRAAEEADPATRIMSVETTDEVYPEDIVFQYSRPVVKPSDRNGYTDALGRFTHVEIENGESQG